MRQTFWALLGVLLIVAPPRQSAGQSVPLPSGQHAPSDVQQRGCLVQHSTFVSRGKQWGPTMCIADKPGEPGQSCYCNFEGEVYPGKYSAE
jgi:hypothetical protein